jgi:hypothetical protein
MTEQPDLSTLPARMRYAADVLREADERYASKHSWSPDGLEIIADTWEDQDRATTERAAWIRELANTIYRAAGWSGNGPHEPHLEAARRLIESGWRKGEPNE